ncbi:MAG: hypothetical protein QM286_14080 [Acidobacteriota bacterium]|nr:hypothetical protein [Acidobacteriota bacterium]
MPHKSAAESGDRDGGEIYDEDPDDPMDAYLARDGQLVPAD